MNREQISPFTNLPGIAGNAFIETHFSDDIIINFENKNSYKYVYKIVGLRGSGKSVEYARVMNHFRKKKDWLVYALASGGNPLQTLLSQLSKEKFINDKIITKSVGGSLSGSGNLAIISASADINSNIQIQDNEHYYSDEAALKDMLTAANNEKYKVLIGIDDIAKTPEMTRFLSILGTVFLEPDKNVRFICTGLSKNIEDFVIEPHLSFFVRNESVKILPLNLHSIAEKYRKFLNASKEEAIALSRFTQGYAYGYQTLGEICFKLKKVIIDEEIEDIFDEKIGPQYDLIWSTLTQAEQDLLKIIVNTDSASVNDIKAQMSHNSGFASLRDRIIKKHVVIPYERGKLLVPLPRFKEYINMWQ